MSRDWRSYLSNGRIDAGRAIIEQGNRIHEARQSLSEKRFLSLLASIGISPRDARLLTRIGHRLHPLMTGDSSLRFPYRTRTLSALADLSADVLVKATEGGRIHPSTTEAEIRSMRGTSAASIPPVIRPTDNWSFSTLRWPRIDGWEGHGYIPGDLYANCLWYYARENDTVVDPMAGSGMIRKVWEERAEWSEGETRNIKIEMSDLVPRGPYANHIQECDLMEEIPIDCADYIIVDPPYCGLVKGQYSDLSTDLANMDATNWIKSMQIIAKRFREVQPDDGRCTIIVPNSRTISTGERTLFPEIIRRIFQQAGYILYDVTYASRRTQQRQGRHMGILNNRARREKVPMADVSEVLTFISGSVGTDSSLETDWHDKVARV